MKAISRVILTFFVLLSALHATSNATAQSTKESVTSVVTGAVIELDSTDGAAFKPEYYALEEPAPGQQQESIVVVTDMGQVMISFATGMQTPDTYIRRTISAAPGWYSDFVDILGYDSTNESGWYLFRGTFRNNLHDYSYCEVYRGNDKGTVTVVNMYTATPDSALSLISWVQENLTIDGEHVFTTTDEPAVEAMLDGTSGIEPERVYGFSSEIADWEEQGLVSDTEWVSPTWGTAVNWDGVKLYFPTHRYDTILVDSEINADYLYLYGQNQDGLISVAINKQLERPADMTMQEFYQDRYTSEGWLTGSGMNYPSHAFTESENAVSVVYSTTDSLGNEIIYIRTVWEPTEDVFIVFDVTNRPELVAGTYLNVIDSVTFDGKPVEKLWSHDELTALFPPSTEGAAEPRDISKDRPAIDGNHIWNPQD